MHDSNITKDFNGLPIVFREDGYINMTKAAKHFGKDLSNFTRSPETLAYLAAFGQTVEYMDCLMIHAKRGGAKGTAGTWCHPKLAVFFARWLDVRFAVWCDLMIDNHPTGQHSDNCSGPHAGGCAVSTIGFF